MIKEEEVYQIGTFGKPHGIHGEILFSFTDDIFDRSDCNYIVCSIDNILVPFFIKEYRFRGDYSALITIEGIDDEEKARQFMNFPVYFPRKYASDDDINGSQSWDYFNGFKIVTEENSPIGEIEYTDDSTSNVLFCVKHQNNEFLIPAQENFILGIDHKKKIITMQLPEGLLDLSND